MAHDRGASLGAAGRHDEQAFRQVCAHDLAEQLGAASGVRRRFEHDGVAGHQRWRCLPERDRDREVPRCDQAGDAMGTSFGIEQSPERRRKHRADLGVGGLRVELQDRHRSPNLASGLTEWLANLAHHEIDHVAGARSQLHRDCRERGRSPSRAESDPVALRLTGTCHGSRNAGVGLVLRTRQQCRSDAAVTPSESRATGITSSLRRRPSQSGHESTRRCRHQGVRAAGDRAHPAARQCPSTL